MFGRRGRSCGEKPQPRVAPPVEGHVGGRDVEFTNLPYRACACGRLAQWAFDPGLEFSEQLFYKDSGAPSAKGRIGAARCRRCDAPLGDPEMVTLEAIASLTGFEPITMRIRLRGYRCPACGTAQAPAGEFDASRWGSRSTDTGKALDAALRSLGLSD